MVLIRDVMTGMLIQTVRRSAYDVNRDLGRKAMMEMYDAGTVGGIGLPDCGSRTYWTVDSLLRSRTCLV